MRGVAEALPRKGEAARTDILGPAGGVRTRPTSRIHFVTLFLLSALLAAIARLAPPLPVPVLPLALSPPFSVTAPGLPPPPF